MSHGRTHPGDGEDARCIAGPISFPTSFPVQGLSQVLSNVAARARPSSPLAAISRPVLRPRGGGRGRESTHGQADMSHYCNSNCC